MTLHGYCPSEDEMTAERAALTPDERAQLDALPKPLTEHGPAWPIRVGGLYRSANTPNLSRLVTAIDGNTIHTRYFHHDYPNDPLGSDSGMSAWLFRQTTHPEDQSPLATLYTLLDRTRTALLAPSGIADLTELLDAIDTALVDREKHTHAR